MTAAVDDESNALILVPGTSRLALGAFGEISLALIIMRHNKGNDRIQLVAVKKIYTAAANMNDDDRTSVPTEVRVLRQLVAHDNVCKLVIAPYQLKTANDTFFHAPASWCIAMPYCPTDLQVSLEWRRQRRRHQPSSRSSISTSRLLPWRVLEIMTQDLLQAVQHCHAQGVVHCDIKPGNCLISCRGRLQLCDFGTASVINVNSGDGDNYHDNNNKTALCTLYYRPPEMLVGLPDDCSSHAAQALDYWSAAVTVLECVLGHTVWPGRSELDQLGRIFTALGTPTITTNWPVAARDMPLQFAAVPAPASLVDVWPRLGEHAGLLACITALLHLDPARRRCEELSTTTTLDADRQWLLAELVPPALMVPPLLTDVTVATRQALQVAHRRKTFLRSDQPNSTWNDEE